MFFGATGDLAYKQIFPALSMFAAVAANLAAAGCAQDARVVVEKPFGRDLKSAQDLDRTLHECFPEGGNGSFPLHLTGYGTVDGALGGAKANPA